MSIQIQSLYLEPELLEPLLQFSTTLKHLTFFGGYGIQALHSMNKIRLFYRVKMQNTLGHR